MKRKFIYSTIYFVLISTQLLILNSCKKFTDIDSPTDQLNSDLVFADSSTAVSAITGIYSDMATGRNLFANSATTLYGGLCADELYFYTQGTRDEFTKNQITQANHFTIGNAFWKPAYKSIYAANLAIEKLALSQNISLSLKNQLTGEAKFIRAFCYFHLVNLFGDVPLIVSSKYQDAAIAPRVAVAHVYTQIVQDLNDAKILLSAQYISTERVRPNRWTAIALLSRCYLYTNRWQEAETEASSIIASGAYALESDLNNVFIKNSGEAIWQLMPVRPGANTYEALEILPLSNFSSPTYLITLTLRNSFENGDNRKSVWIKSRVFNNDTLYFPFKYKVSNSPTLNEYYTVFRLAEQYLIRAEAELNQNKIVEAQADINILRNRAGLSNTSANTNQLLKQALEKERRIELFSEWAHRWFDLKRTGRASEVLSIIKGSTWQPTDTLWPIPQQELNLNPSLTQNPGY